MGSFMALAGNIVWWLTLGPVLSLAWFLVGCAMFLTVIGIPFGRACFTMSKLTLAPFGQDIVSTAELRMAKAAIADNEEMAKGNMAMQSIGFIAKVIWFPLGLILAIAHALHGVILFIPLITIPLGIQELKIAGLALFPIGKRVVSIELARKVREALADRALAQAS